MYCRRDRTPLVHTSLPLATLQPPSVRLDALHAAGQHAPSGVARIDWGSRAGGRLHQSGGDARANLPQSHLKGSCTVDLSEGSCKPLPALLASVPSSAHHETRPFQLSPAEISAAPSRPLMSLLWP